jgi:hypothetical protein
MSHGLLDDAERVEQASVAALLDEAAFQVEPIRARATVR